MDRNELKELHYITPIQNLPSILERGLLSHHRAARLQHQTVAMPQVQARRAKVKVPGGHQLHAYVNLYLHARNPMMYKRRKQHRRLCVLSVSVQVLDLPGVVVADGNAASRYCRFASSPDGLDIVAFEWAFARYWTHDDPLEEARRRVARCAEVLVPDRVAPTFIQRVYVSCDDSDQAVNEVTPNIDTKIYPYLFFR